MTDMNPEASSISSISVQGISLHLSRLTSGLSPKSYLSFNCLPSKVLMLNVVDRDDWSEKPNIEISSANFKLVFLQGS